MPQGFIEQLIGSKLVRGLRQHITVHEHDVCNQQWGGRVRAGSFVHPKAARMCVREQHMLIEQVNGEYNSSSYRIAVLWFEATYQSA
jgi:hypothetical protein